jgi:spore germination cell wall hydrolase CwlJ-like protein
MTTEPSPELACPSSADVKLKASEEDIDIAARTVWGEARGEGEAGMQAVAAVLINRALAARSFIAAKAGRKKHPLFGDGSLTSAAQAAWQFSCWNKNDPNRDKLIKLSKADPGYIKAKAAVTWALSNQDPTDGATHYYANSIAAPDWTKDATFTKKIGQHLFYKNVK